MISELTYTTTLKPYDRSVFDCGTPALNSYLESQVNQDVKKHLAICYLALVNSDIIGFYTLSQHLIERQEFPDKFQKKIPRTYDGPATLIGRFAIDKKYQGKGYGKTLLMHALYKIYVGSQNSATLGAVVIAKDTSENFYIKQGFVPLLAEGKKYFLPIKVIEKSIPEGLRI